MSTFVQFDVNAAQAASDNAPLAPAGDGGAA